MIVALIYSPSSCTCRSTSSRSVVFKCRELRMGSERSRASTSCLVLRRVRIDRMMTPSVPRARMFNFSAARRAAISSVSRRQPSCAAATRSEAISPASRGSIRKIASCSVASPSTGSGTTWSHGQTSRGRCLSTSAITALGTRTGDRSSSRSRHLHSSKWISGPASATTVMKSSFPAMQSPGHILLDEPFLRFGSMRRQKATHRLPDKLFLAGKAAEFHSLVQLVDFRVLQFDSDGLHKHQTTPALKLCRFQASNLLHRSKLGSSAMEAIL